MNRRLQLVNLIGVAVLALVCVLQWQRDRALNLELNRCEKARIELQSKLVEQEKNLRGATGDLAMFKEQHTRATRENSDVTRRLQELERENQLLTSARDQLQTSVTNWSAAVAARDKLIAQANDNIRTLNYRTRTLAEQLNASVQKFNELATNYAAVVKRMNSPGTVGATKSSDSAAR